MKKKMIIHYDAEGDLLEVRFGRPAPSYYKELGNDTFERREESTNKLIGYAFFNVKKRLSKPQEIEIDLPISI